jgi:nicotinate-nucleotide pyrophosphorylase (carboxylating)
MPLIRTSLEQIVTVALDEDLGRGDITTEACVDSDQKGSAVLRARERLVFCGMEVLREVYRQVDPSIETTPRCRDGQVLESGDAAALITGRAASLLMGERVALNFIQRMSGIATLTRAFVEKAPPDSSTRITDTRKTTAGLRLLERYAVRCGGGYNHREDLSAAVLIKDNHVAACGGIRQAVERAHARAPHTSRITCEVDSMEQLSEALEAKVDVVLLDNFDDAMIREAVSRVAGRALVEVSGGVTLERIATVARLGVDVISVGALTHSAPAVDLGLDFS